jgi:hypothetical protein
MKNKPALDVGIHAQVVYSLETFREITGLGAAALRSMRRAGFAVAYVGGRGFINPPRFQQGKM